MTIFRVLQRINHSIYEVLFPVEKAFVYVAIGDSTVEGIGASAPHKSYTGIIHETLKDSKKSVAYHNLGKDGAKIKDVLQTQLERAIGLQPDLVTISIGANDVRGLTRTVKFKKIIDEIFHRLNWETKAKIVINTIPDLSVTPRVPRHVKPITRLMVKRFNRIIEKYAVEYNVVAVDMYEQVRTYAKIHPEIVGDDGFHPSDFGYAMWANTILSEINHILFPKQQQQYQFTYNYKK
jgi:lysophospholipase L1-like esterase